MPQAQSESCPGKSRPGLAFLFAIISLLLGAEQGFAQPTTSPLAGKTIRVYNPAPGEPLFVELSDTGHPMAPVAETNSQNDSTDGAYALSIPASSQIVVLTFVAGSTSIPSVNPPPP